MKGEFVRKQVPTDGKSKESDQLEGIRSNPEMNAEGHICFLVRLLHSILVNSP